MKLPRAFSYTFLLNHLVDAAWNETCSQRAHTGEMFIGLCGGQYQKNFWRRPESNPHLGICAGKHSVAKYLVEHRGFYELHLARTSSTPLVEKSASEARLFKPGLEDHEKQLDGVSFSSVNLLLEHVTKQWHRRWVTTDIWDEEILESLLRRPFFLLVSVDAPITLRWERFKERLSCTLYIHLFFYVAHDLQGVRYMVRRHPP